MVQDKVILSSSLLEVAKVGLSPPPMVKTLKNKKLNNTLFENNINMASLSAQICVSETKAMKKKSPKGLVIALEEKGLNCEVN